MCVCVCVCVCVCACVRNMAELFTQLIESKVLPYFSVCVCVCVKYGKTFDSTYCQKFCHISVHASLQYVYHVTEAIQAVESIHFGLCADMYIASLHVRFESQTDKYAM